MADTATIRYRLDLPHALHPISPALSALHLSRATALYPEYSTALRPTHCSKCGTYYFSGDRPSCLVSSSMKKKRKRSSHSKTLRRHCHVCGFSFDARISPSLDHSTPIQSPRDSSETGTKEISQEPRPMTKCIPMPGRQFHLKPKTSTLKDMLSRNRQREEAAKSLKKKNQGHDGLAAFLKEL